MPSSEQRRRFPATSLHPRPPSPLSRSLDTYATKSKTGCFPRRNLRTHRSIASDCVELAFRQRERTIWILWFRCLPPSPSPLLPREVACLGQKRINGFSERRRESRGKEILSSMSIRQMMGGGGGSSNSWDSASDRARRGDDSMNHTGFQTGIHASPINGKIGRAR